MKFVMLEGQAGAAWAINPAHVVSVSESVLKPGMCILEMVNDAGHSAECFVKGTVVEVVGKLEGSAPDSARNIPWEKQLEADRDRYRAALVEARHAPLMHQAHAVIDAALGVEQR